MNRKPKTGAAGDGTRKPQAVKPSPFHLKANDKTGRWEIHDKAGHICELDSESQAALIVRAVNAHASLVESLRDLIALETGDHESCSWCDADDIRRHASDCPFYAAYTTLRAAGEDI